MTKETDFFEKSFGKKHVLLQADAARQKELIDSQTRFMDAERESRLAKEQQYRKKLADLRSAGYSEESDQIKQTTKAYEAALDERERFDEEYQETRKRLEEGARAKAQQEAVKAFQKLNVAERLVYQKGIAAKIKAEREGAQVVAAVRQESAKKLETQLAQKEKAAKSLSGKALEEANKEIEALREQQEIAASEAADAKELANKLAEQERAASSPVKLSAKDKYDLVKNREARKQFVEYRVEGAKEKREETINKVATARSKLDEFNNKRKEAWNKRDLELQEKIANARAAGDKEHVQDLEAQRAREKAKHENDKTALEEKAALETELNQAVAEDNRAALEQAAASFADTSNKLFDHFTSGMTDATEIDRAIDALFNNRAKMMARLQGSAEDWGLAVDAVSDAIGFSGIANKRTVVEKMEQLVDTGVAYNIEMRAFLADTANNIASTFNAFDANLLRIVRLQQQDSTAHRLGLEASLTKLFNEYFSDNSYLVDAFDSVAAAVLDASATMDRDESLEFEYTLQKWLGSLYSLGMSSTGVQAIAEGINYLGTGNVSALSGNTALQTLLTASVARTPGLSYADMLSEGLDSSKTNLLLKSMVEYLAEIANSQTNNVVKSAYAGLFNMSLTDLNTFASLKTEEITSLYNNIQTSDDLIQETQNQLNQLSSRMSIAQMVNNVVDNALTGVASTIGGNAFTYGTWKTVNFLQKAVGKIEIPGITFLGSGTTSAIDLLNLAETGLVGFGVLGSVLGALGSLANGGPTNLALWGDYNVKNTRGAGLGAVERSIFDTVSYSASLGVGSASSSDVEAASLAAAKDKGYDAAGVTSAEVEESKDVPKDIYDAIASSETSSLVSLLSASNDMFSNALMTLESINTRVDPNRVFYTALVGAMNSEAAAKLMQLSSEVTVAQANANKPSAEAVVTETSQPAATTHSTSEQLNGFTSAEELFNQDSLQTVIEDAIVSALTRAFGASLGGFPATDSTVYSRGGW